jgi:hypothetical protein
LVFSSTFEINSCGQTIPTTVSRLATWFQNYCWGGPTASISQGASDTLPCHNIVRSISMHDSLHEVWPWYSRVPSKSNPADGPSRLEFPEKLLDYRLIIEEAPQPLSLSDGIWRWRKGVLAFYSDYWMAEQYYTVLTLVFHALCLLLRVWVCVCFVVFCCAMNFRILC